MILEKLNLKKYFQKYFQNIFDFQKYFSFSKKSIRKSGKIENQKIKIISTSAQPPRAITT